ncbi:ABC transporter substrate-binding protein [Phytoactinopolyspora halotolerans]|uniref:Extracellular solute-binding protein n=1 Tax=Phytoactinopolyspora halotolerans TaxID=1981512 RepID=A0A6L9SGD2_9ACTN|nr:extracellular solute-binding protein [Phytoactinopolyspora halotolerans]NEE04203.1 extracellular solute-binding protein [Phytoactinopolyspora halotolerans]
MSATTRSPAMTRSTPTIDRRTVLRWASGLGAAAILPSCARGTLTRAAPGDDVTLNNDNPTWAPGFESAGEVLRAKTGHGFAIRAVPDVSSYQQVVRMSAQTDSTTDLVKWWNGYRLQDVARAEIFADLTAAWDEAERNGWVDPSLRESFSYDGKPYAVPIYQSYYAVFYSRPAYQRLGLEVPQDWDQFIANAQALRDDGVTPILSAGASSWESLIWFQQLLIGLDPDFYAALTEGAASYTDDTAQEAMAIWADMYEQKLFSPPDSQVTELPGRFAEGSVGMNLHGVWNANAFAQAGVDEDTFGLFLLPAVAATAPPAVVTESGALAVTVNAHKMTEALEVAGAWLDTDVQQAWVDFLSDLSANPSALPPVQPVQDLAAQIEQASPVLATRYWEASPPVLVEGNVEELSAFMTEPTLAMAKSTLQRMQNRADAEWDRWSM